MMPSATTLNPTTPAALGILSRGSLICRDGGQYREATTMKKCNATHCDRMVVRAPYCKAHYHHKFMTGQNPDGHKLRLRMPKMPVDKQLDWLLEHKTEMVGECLEWTGAYTSGGYGHCALGRISRLVAKRKFGDALTDDLVVRHTCDNRGCVLADHLEIGTYKDNMLDAVKRRRIAHGERQWYSKLTEKDVREIKSLIKNVYFTQVDIAKKFGVTNGAISSIARGRTWKHVKD